MEDTIIVALDNLDCSTALDLAKKLKGSVWGFKVNDLLYGASDMMISDLFGTLSECGRIMFDPKWHDIPNTVANYIGRINNLPIDLVTVHASGGWQMINVAVESAKAEVAAVTVLTSHNDIICNTVYHRDVAIQVEVLVDIAVDAGAHNIVCSPVELGILQDRFFKKIVPGIRPNWYSVADDQKRVATPAGAVAAGATRLVIGRPIVKAEDPVEAVGKTLNEIKRGL